jgi:hypothetical protein
MFAVIGFILFIIAWFEHGSAPSGIPVWFNYAGTALLGLACVAAQLAWPLWRDRRHP